MMRPSLTPLKDLHSYSASHDAESIHSDPQLELDEHADLDHDSRDAGTIASFSSIHSASCVEAESSYGKSGSETGSVASTAAITQDQTQEATSTIVDGYDNDYRASSGYEGGTDHSSLIGSTIDTAGTNLSEWFWHQTGSETSFDGSGYDHGGTPPHLSYHPQNGGLAAPYDTVEKVRSLPQDGVESGNMEFASGGTDGRSEDRLPSGPQLHEYMYDPAAATFGQAGMSNDEIYPSS